MGQQGGDGECNGVGTTTARCTMQWLAVQLQPDMLGLCTHHSLPRLSAHAHDARTNEGCLLNTWANLVGQDMETEARCTATSGVSLNRP